MRALSAEDLLTIVEHGSGASPTAAALAMLACATTDGPASDLAGLSLGVRDRRLLELREKCIGGVLEARVSCPACAAELELALSPDTLVVDAPAMRDLVMRHGELELGFRLPTSADLLSVEDCANEEQAARRLASRCVESATRAGIAIRPHLDPDVDPASGPEFDRQIGAELDAAELEVLGEAMVAADPQADLAFELRCVECGAEFERELDVAAFVSAELGAAARRLFAEIHTLARGYGWSESDILAMSAWRRRAYARMLAG